MKRLTGGTAWIGVTGVVIMLVFAGSSYAKIEPKNIAGLWLFDDAKGDTATDASANRNNATLMGKVKWVGGKFGSAAELDGAASNYVSVASSDSLKMKDEVTVMFWVRTGKKMVDMWADRQAVVGKHYTEYEVGIYTAGQLHTYTWGDNANGYDEGIMAKIADAEWKLDKWYHVAWSLKGRHEIAYVDGVKIGEFDKATQGTRPGANTLEIGRRVGGSLPVTGAVDEVAVFNVALDQKDIQTAVDRGLAVAVGIAAVEPAGKLAIAWGEVKRR